MGSDSDVNSEMMTRLQQVINRVLSAAGRTAVKLHPGLSLVDDLGMDSVMFIDLTLEVESQFRITAFPMQAWADVEAQRKSDRFTVASLARAISEVQPDARG
jgi:acyl carrier protein